MNFPLLPRWLAKDVTRLRPDFFRENGIQLIMLDFDNTLIPYTTNDPTPEVVYWLSEMKVSGFCVCVISNSYKERVKQFCSRYGIDCITGAKKPFSKGIRECLSKYKIGSDNAVLIGDQIYTDTLGGNCAGVRTVLVRSIHNHTFWLKLRHVAELPFILIARKRRTIL